VAGLDILAFTVFQANGGLTASETRHKGVEVKRLRSPRKWTLLALAAALASLATALIPAVATAAPDFTCPEPALCVFQGSNFDGNVTSFVPSLVGDQWLSLTANGLSLPWGSLNNNSGSCVLFGNASAPANQQLVPVLPFTREDGAQLSAFPYLQGGRWIYIEYGNPNCTKSPIPHIP
jgi:hypothetical protein